jgi:hypothetical protein
LSHEHPSDRLYCCAGLEDRMLLAKPAFESLFHERGKCVGVAPRLVEKLVYPFPAPSPEHC